MELQDLLNEALTAGGVQVDTFFTRICTKCKKTKVFDDFSFHSRTKADKRAGIRRKKAQCKDCDSRYKVEYFVQNGREASRASYNKNYYANRYGVTKELSAALAVPGARTMPCPICHKIDNLVLDHDHNTGANRDLICSSCNFMLGHANESLDTLYNAIAYLKKHRGV